MTKNKLIGSTYVNIIKDEKGEIKFAYGYEVDDNEVSLNDIMALQSFLDMLKTKADQDFKDRIDVSEKKYEVGIEDLEEDN